MELVTDNKNPKKESEYADIMPDHSPVVLVKDMTEEVENGSYVAGCYMLIDEEDEITYDMAGVKRKDLLWMLERMKQKLLRGDC